MEKFQLNLSRVSDNDKYKLIQFLSRVLPWLCSTACVGWIGFSLGEVISNPGYPFLTIINGGILISLLILREEPAWNLVLLFAYAAVNGLLLAKVGLGENWGWIWVSLGFLVLLSLVWEFLKRGVAGIANKLFLFLAAPLFLGWVIINIYPVQGVIYYGWALLTSLVFISFLTSIYQQGFCDENRKDIIPLVCDLEIIVVNWIWLVILVSEFWGK